MGKSRYSSISSGRKHSLTWNVVVSKLDGAKWRNLTEIGRKQRLSKNSSENKLNERRCSRNSLRLRGRLSRLVKHKNHHQSPKSRLQNHHRKATPAHRHHQSPTRTKMNRAPPEGPPAYQPRCNRLNYQNHLQQ